MIGGFLTIILTGNKVCFEAFLGVEISLLIGIIVMVLGGIVYWKYKDEYGLTALIIGLVSLPINGFFLMMGIASGML